MPSIFRDRAIAAQSGYDALDRSVRVVPVRAWLALALALVVLGIGALWLFGGTVTVRADGPATIVNAPGNVTVVAPVDGIVVGEGVAVGGQVAAGDVVATITSGPGQAEIPVTAAVAGEVVGVGPGQGASVKAGEQLAVLAPNSDTQVAYAFLPTGEVAGVAPGAAAWVLPDNVDPTAVGYVRGRVASVSPLPVPTSRVAYLLADPGMAERVTSAGPVVEVVIALAADAGTPSGLDWTQYPGPATPVVSGTPATASIDRAQVAPYQAFFHG